MSVSCYVKELAFRGANLPVAAGLSVSQTSLKWDPKVLGCCHGQGYRLAGTNELERCDLRPRLATLEVLQRRCLTVHRQLGAERLDFRVTQKALDRQLYQGLLRLANRPTQDALRRPRTGQIFNDFAKDNRPTQDLQASANIIPGQSWLLAFAAAWHFGLRPHIVTIGITKAQDLLPKDCAATGQIVIVQGLSKLWQADHLNDFELIISYAYNSSIPLWLGLDVPIRLGDQRREEQNERTSARQTSQSLMSDKSSKLKLSKRSPSPFDQRLNTLRNRSPLGWIPRSLLSKCQSICAGPWPRELLDRAPFKGNLDGNQYPGHYGGLDRGIPRDV